MRLALALGQPSVDAMLEEMSPREYKEWLAFDDKEPVDTFNQLVRIAAVHLSLTTDHSVYDVVSVMNPAIGETREAMAHKQNMETADQFELDEDLQWLQ